MDELEFLKQNWKKQEENLPHLSYDEIYNMIWKKIIFHSKMDLCYKYN